MKIFQNIDPSLRCRPDFVHGTPVARETLRLAFVTPRNRFQLNPPRFTVAIVPHNLNGGNGTYALLVGLSVPVSSACERQGSPRLTDAR